jgi:DNA-binding transcriptional ArsR family regulator
LKRLAAVHAALGDPSRLQIVNTLTAGDASPSELSTRLGMPSNLLAHHLKVLQSAGLIVRQQSEGESSA